ncbi:MAG: acetolactate synthase small subunit [Nitrospinota bacterium]|mgnify:CR=1 FL=1|jgi:acetolactate synthase-1/3 small subunit|nr:acetolactate synthase small subunit [Nitrospinota bacterium]MDP6365682.1 acetolactate synthase small subunit [Nitrospinota bacterium]MDP7168160.1 acetolactate synthase small subunit [Nitrospinota bacterium]MDP7370692.1 acetolactate synthase small subunit [Nitrospinota bacterium]MDP7503394.1 acetolactate synthase small subunit [Nitrospinota bacterium]|tara:strand:- start:1961 stop:2464 length:504 start_codon:yes stop_codon:yes gene_type:complete
MRQVFSILVNNHAGVLSHVSGLFARRGYNIESIAAGPTENPEATRIVIVAFGEEETLEQIAHQLRKLYDVLEVEQLQYNRSVTRELVLATVSADADKRTEVLQIANAFGANIVNITDNTVTLEASGNDHKTRILIKALERYGISNMARTGMIALPFDEMTDEWEPLA